MVSSHNFESFSCDTWLSIWKSRDSISCFSISSYCFTSTRLDFLRTPFVLRRDDRKFQLSFPSLLINVRDEVDPGARPVHKTSLGDTNTRIMRRWWFTNCERFHVVYQGQICFDSSSDSRGFVVCVCLRFVRPRWHPTGGGSCERRNFFTPHYFLESIKSRHEYLWPLQLAFAPLDIVGFLLPSGFGRVSPTRGNKKKISLRKTKKLSLACLFRSMVQEKFSGLADGFVYGIRCGICQPWSNFHLLYFRKHRTLAPMALRSIFMKTYDRARIELSMMNDETCTMRVFVRGWSTDGCVW